MKIICVATPLASDNDMPASAGCPSPTSRDEAQDAAGLHLYLKPETAISRSDWPFFVPDWSEDIRASVQLVVRINRLGKSIPERYAHRYYDEVTLGISFTAHDMLKALAAKGLPWATATGFDGAAYCGQQWLRLSELRQDDGRPAEIQNLGFDVRCNDEAVKHCSTRDMLHTVDEVIAYASRYYLLKTGDLIFTGSPTVTSRVSEGDVISAQLAGQQVLTCRCK